jgi:predicted Zn-dependent protease
LSDSWWVCSIPFCAAQIRLPPGTIELAAGSLKRHLNSSFDNRRRIRKFPRREIAAHSRKMAKIEGQKEILEQDPKNSFARYGLAMELAGCGETAKALAEFDTLLVNDPDYTSGYFMAAQTLAAAGRKREAIERLKAGIACAYRSGNSHAANEMQAMLDELGQ